MLKMFLIITNKYILKALLLMILENAFNIFNTSKTLLIKCQKDLKCFIGSLSNIKNIRNVFYKLVVFFIHEISFIKRFNNMGCVVTLGWLFWVNTNLIIFRQVILKNCSFSYLVLKLAQLSTQIQAILLEYDLIFINLYYYI